MSTQRLVDCRFWDDSYIISLDPSEKLVFLYLLTNPLSNIAGVYELSTKRIGFDTGFDQDTVKRILERFQRDEKCIYRDGWIAMRNWIKHQQVNPNVRKGISRVLSAVPQDLASYVMRKPLEALPKDSLLNLTQPNLTQPSGDVRVQQFEEWWSRYPRKVGKQQAMKCYSARLKEGTSVEELTKARDGYLKYLAREKTEMRYVMHPSTFLGPNGRWKDYLHEQQAGQAVSDPLFPARLCPKCGDANTHTGSMCWKCGADLGEAKA